MPNNTPTVTLNLTNYGSYTGDRVLSIIESEWAAAAMQPDSKGKLQKPADRTWAQVPAPEKFSIPQDFNDNAAP